jgi:hypothetical protein
VNLIVHVHLWMVLLADIDILNAEQPFNKHDAINRSSTRSGAISIRTKITFTKKCTFYLTYKMLKFTIKTSIILYSPLHVSVHLDHLQGAYGDPC